MKEYELLLVRLPKIKEVKKEFYGIGYFSENGEFIFTLLSPEMIRNFPLRTIKPKEWSDQEYESQNGYIIGKVERLPNPLCMTLPNPPEAI